MTGAFTSAVENGVHVYTYVRGDHALLLTVDDTLATLSEHVAVRYPAPEGPCSLFNDGRCCVSSLERTRFPPERHADATHAAAYLCEEWELRWGDGA